LEEKVFTGQGHAETNLDLPSVIRFDHMVIHGICQDYKELLY
jgi:hypothetical protein